MLTDEKGPVWLNPSDVVAVCSYDLDGYKAMIWLRTVPGQFRVLETVAEVIAKLWPRRDAQPAPSEPAPK